MTAICSVSTISRYLPNSLPKATALATQAKVILSLFLLSAGEAFAMQPRAPVNNNNVARTDITSLLTGLGHPDTYTRAKTAVCGLMLFAGSTLITQYVMDYGFLGGLQELRSYLDNLCTGRSSASPPKNLTPYVEAVKRLEWDHGRYASFPPDLDAFLYNGLMLNINGDAACSLQDGLELMENCEFLCHDVKEVVKERNQEQFVYTDSAFKNQGTKLDFEVDVGDEKRQIYVRLGLDPKFKENYQKAISKITTDVLLRSDFFNKKPAEIVDYLKKIHKIMMKGLLSGSEGSFRKTLNYVFREPGWLGKYGSMENWLLQLGISEKEHQLFLEATKKLMDLKENEIEISKLLSKEELKVMNKIVYYPPSWVEVPNLMIKFAIDLKYYVAQRIHPVAIAAWAHCELGRIHPFSDGNGRLSRLFMNTLLAMNGFKPVIIFDDDEYTTAVKEDDIVPGTFAKYLARLIEERG